MIESDDSGVTDFLTYYLPSPAFVVVPLVPISGSVSSKPRNATKFLNNFTEGDHDASSSDLIDVDVVFVEYVR